MFRKHVTQYRLLLLLLLLGVAAAAAPCAARCRLETVAALEGTLLLLLLLLAVLLLLLLLATAVTARRTGLGVKWNNYNGTCIDYCPYLVYTLHQVVNKQHTLDMLRSLAKAYQVRYLPYAYQAWK